MKRVFSGARPTGKQHLGNYLGAIQNYVRLQAEYQCVYCIVDLHALTTLEDTRDLKQNIRDMALDWLAAGLEPQKSIIFVQSHVPEVTELHVLFSMITPLSWLMRVPTFKEKAKSQPHNVNYGLVGYPVLMTADITLYKAEVVPVGEDQIPHLELAREIVRRFNTLFGYVFPEPEAKLTTFPIVLGLDGKEKMSKTAGNVIELALSPEELTEKIKTAVTDTARVFRRDVGHPEVCNIYRFHKYFNPSQSDEIAQQCRTAQIGCVDCKTVIAREINNALAPFRQHRAEFAARKGYVEEVLADGARRAQAIASETIREAKEKMGLL
ncbi:MAG: tryptophan--tRNA ligase [Dehalococcoidia bacterium]|nr:tryptophan--tRNA ligase [Dehalococcoidia bacterium]